MHYITQPGKIPTTFPFHTRLWEARLGILLESFSKPPAADIQVRITSWLVIGKPFREVAPWAAHVTVSGEQHSTITTDYIR